MILTPCQWPDAHDQKQIDADCALRRLTLNLLTNRFMASPEDTYHVGKVYPPKQSDRRLTSMLL